MASSSRAAQDDLAGVLLESTKRQTVLSACENCRIKKVKCNGQLPCSHCSQRGLECVFDTNPNETVQQGRKRKLDQLAQRVQDFERLFDCLARHDRTSSNDLFRRIRRGESVESLFKLIQPGDTTQDEITNETKLRRLFLSSLIQSTASLGEVATTASRVLLDGRIVVPSAQAYEQLQDRVVTMEKLSRIVTESNRTVESSSLDAHTTAVVEHVLVLWVPAEPWVEGVSDETISRLISFFFSFLNPFWRYVEQANFLASMRSRDVKSQYCTPLLVNAMAALSSLHSEVSDDLRPQKPFPERGLGFHDEAVRLWNLEESRPCVTSIQALMCLTVGCVLRGKDVLGMNLLNSGTTLNSILPCPEPDADMAKAELDYVHVRGCAWWTAVHVDLTYKMGLLMGSDATNWDHAPDLRLILPDTTDYWRGYPGVDRPVEYRPNLLFLERCNLTRFLWEAMKILVWDAKQLEGTHVRIEAVNELSERMESWYARLPLTLQFADWKPPSLYDIHTQYYCVQMTLHELAFAQSLNHINPRIRTQADEALQQELSTKTLGFAYHVSNLIRGFRERYGLKFMSLVHLNHSVIGVFIGLNDLHAHPLQSSSVANSFTHTVRDTPTALEEFFRILLANTFQGTLSRRFARTAYHTAQALKIALPDTITETLKAMAATTSQSTDLEPPSTAAYLNWSLPHAGGEEVEGYRMETILKQWEDQRARAFATQELDPDMNGPVLPRLSELPRRME